MNDDSTPLERLEAQSKEIEELASNVAVRAKAFGARRRRARRASSW